MAQSCGYNYCIKTIAYTPKISRNKIHRDYCSLYCREATLNKLKPTKRFGQGGWDKGDATHLPIAKKCSVCRIDFELKYDANKCNQRFCSRDCYNQLLMMHNGHRDFMILSILHEKGSLTSGDIATITSSFRKRATATGIGLILKAWRGRGIVTAHNEKEGKAFTFTYGSELFPGEAIIKFCRRR